MVLGVIAVRVLYLFIDAHFVEAEVYGGLDVEDVEAEVCRDLDVENSYAKIDGS
jgi:hypothetical protein